MTQSLKEKAEHIKERLKAEYAQWMDDHKGYDLSNLPDDDDKEQEVNFND
jgi:hypothetical protein